MEKPITPESAINYSNCPYDDRTCQFRRDLEKNIQKINRQVGCQLTSDLAGEEAMVFVPLPGISQQMLLSLVHMYRCAGWNVVYGENREPFIKVGIASKISL